MATIEQVITQQMYKVLELLTINHGVLVEEKFFSELNRLESLPGEYNVEELVKELSKQKLIWRKKAVLFIMYVITEKGVAALAEIKASADQ